MKILNISFTSLAFVLLQGCFIFPVPYNPQHRDISSFQPYAQYVGKRIPLQKDSWLVLRGSSENFLTTVQPDTDTYEDFLRIPVGTQVEVKGYCYKKGWGTHIYAIVNISFKGKTYNNVIFEHLMQSKSWLKHQTPYDSTASYTKPHAKYLRKAPWEPSDVPEMRYCGKSGTSYSSE